MTSSLVLTGFMGVGKSAVGELIAAQLGVAFVDTDGVIEAAHGPIATIFAERGEVVFRAIEREVVLATLAHAARLPQVVALGGGAVTDGDVRSALARFAHVAWLDAPPEELFARAAGSERPLAGNEAGFRELYERRRSLYEEVATLRVSGGGGRSPEEVAAELLGALRSEPS